MRLVGLLPFTAGGLLFAFGDNGEGQLGNGTTEDSLVAVTVKAKQQTWKAVACGSEHTMALSEKDGSVFAWGLNDDGQIGVSKSDTSKPQKVKLKGKAVGISCGSYHSAAVTAKGELWAWGQGEQGMPAELISLPPLLFRSAARLMRARMRRARAR